MESSNSWVKLNNVADLDADYAALLDECVDEISNLSGRDLRRHLTLAQFTVFCSSPGSVTPYHIDHETNFLCQIAGEKEVCLWDPRDRGILSEREIERFYTGEINAARYREDLEPKARRFDLRPGLGVHQPPNAPHWVRTGASASITVSVNLSHKDIDRRAHVYQVNHLLRKAGLSPRPPGQSAWVDGVKSLPMSWLGTSKPRSADDVVFSGLERLRAPWYWLRGVK
ncbi:MAG: cupin-like domain-containing protein [Rubrivivax sp.]|nr:cupin-like domain-containing protein [Rubrivivax sp.]